MKTHPIIDYPYRWVPVLVVALVLVLAQVMIMSVYTGADYVPAVIDGIATIKRYQRRMATQVGMPNNRRKGMVDAKVI